MTSLGSYRLPGFQIEDHSIKVPLDWENHSRGQIDLFYRLVWDPARQADDLPWLVFLQGGPGGAGPRPAGGPAWLTEAVQHYRVVLPDQRGTGRSSPVDGEDMARLGDAEAGANYLRYFLADSIVQDLERLRAVIGGDQPWTSLGQSYGGFLTLAYLSRFPRALKGCLIAGGVPGLPPSAPEVHRRAFPQAELLSRRHYRRYPQDREQTAAVAERLAEGDVSLPNGDLLTVPRFQLAGHDLGTSTGSERLHWLLDTAWAQPGRLSDGFLYQVMNRTASASAPLYWPLQEFIYACGANGPLNWSAARELERHPEFAAEARPLLFFGETIFPWMFDQIYELRPFQPAVAELMGRTEWPLLYDQEQLAANETPVEAVVYFDDLYVDAELQLDSLRALGNAHAWVTNQFEHDGLSVDGAVFRRLRQLLLDHGGAGR